MTEELEQRLNELLELKKELQEATEEKRRSVAASSLALYKKGMILNYARYVVALVVGIAIIVAGVLAFSRMQFISIDPISLVLFGILILIAARIGWLVRQTKLSILLEMKQFEGRMMELLKK